MGSVRISVILLPVVVLLQLVLAGAALDTIKSLIDQGTLVRPVAFGSAVILAAGYLVALAASVGRADQTHTRMLVLIVCQAGVLATGILAGVALGGPTNIVLPDSYLPPSEWGRELGLSMITLSQGLALLLTPVSILLAVRLITLATARVRRVPLHVAVTAAGAALCLAILLPRSSTTFRLRQQPDFLVREYFEDPRMRPSARAGLIKLPADERARLRPAIRARLNDADPRVQLAAASILVEMGTDHAEVVAKLIPLLGIPIDRSEIAGVGRPVSTGAAELLGQLGPRAVPAIPALIQLVQNPGKTSVETRRGAAAATALGRIGPPALEVVPLLLEQLRGSKPPWLREAAVEAIDRIDPSLATRCVGNAATLTQAYRQAYPGPLQLKAECTR